MVQYYGTRVSGCKVCPSVPCDSNSYLSLCSYSGSIRFIFSHFCSFYVTEVNLSLFPYFPVIPTFIHTTRSIPFHSSSFSVIPAPLSSLRFFHARHASLLTFHAHPAHFTPLRFDPKHLSYPPLHSGSFCCSLAYSCHCGSFPSFRFIPVPPSSARSL